MTQCYHVKSRYEYIILYNRNLKRILELQSHYIYISSESFQEIFPIEYLDHEIRVLMILMSNLFNQFTLSLVKFSGTRPMTETSYATYAVTLSLGTCQATI